MRRFFYNIKNAIAIGIWAFKNPEVLRDSHFKMLSSLLELILKVSNEHRHYITHIAYIHPEEGENQIVSVWAGSGIGADPVKRIEELAKENALLRDQLSNIVAKQ